MTYGFEAENSSGEIVIDGEYPVEVLSVEKTVTGTLYSSGVYEFPFPSSTSIRFWKLDVGDTISQFPSGFLGSKSSFVVRDSIPVSQAPAPTGYGMVVYDALGNRVFQADKETVSIGDRYTVQGNLGGSTKIDAFTSDKWVHIADWNISVLTTSTSFATVFSGGVTRDTSSKYIAGGAAYDTGASGPNFSRPTTFVTMKG